MYYLYFYPEPGIEIFIIKTIIKKVEDYFWETCYLLNSSVKLYYRTHHHN